MKVYYGLLGLILFAGSSASAQETILVENRFDNSKQVSEKFYVLKSDGKTKHGSYIKYNRASEEDMMMIKKGLLKPEHFTKDSGAFSFGKKSGYWKEYSASNKLIGEGNYKEGNKVGVWLTYIGWEVVKQFDYDHNKQLPPRIFLHHNYPAVAREKGIQGTVTIKYQLRKDCSFSEIRIEKSVSPECDSSALYAVRRLETLNKEYGVDCPDSTITLDVKYELR